MEFHDQQEQSIFKIDLNSLLYCNCTSDTFFILCSPDYYAQSIDKLRSELGELENSKKRVALTMVEIDKKIEQVKLNILSAELEKKLAFLQMTM